jgi:hypothetical protein
MKLVPFQRDRIYPASLSKLCYAEARRISRIFLDSYFPILSILLILSENFCNIGERGQ